MRTPLPTLQFSRDSYDINNYPEPDVNEAQFLNKDGNAYYRAVLAKSVLDIQDQFGLTKWKDCKRAGGNDEDCIKEVTYTKDGANAANTALGLKFDDDGNCLPDTDAGIKCIEIGDPRFETRAAFSEYLADKYARLSPSFRLVQSAGKLKASEEADIADGAEGWSRLVIMETTIDQLNSFAADNLGFAVEYASRY